MRYKNITNTNFQFNSALGKAKINEFGSMDFSILDDTVLQKFELEDINLVKMHNKVNLWRLEQGFHALDIYDFYLFVEKLSDNSTNANYLYNYRYQKYIKLKDRFIIYCKRRLKLVT